MGITKDEAIIIDHQKARDHIGKYQILAVNRIISRGLILNGAIQDFNKFRDLPPDDNSGAAIWDFAFALLSTAVPALRLGEFFKNQYERASIALKAAETFGKQARRADQAMKVVSKGLETGGKIAKGIDDAKGILEKADKLSPVPKDLSITRANASVVIGRAEPGHWDGDEKWSVALSERHLVGPLLIALLCALSLRMRLSRRRIQEFLGEWLGLQLAVATINQCLHEAGRALEPVLEEQLLPEVRGSELIHADETSWKEHGRLLWLGRCLPPPRRRSLRSGGAPRICSTR